MIKRIVLILTILVFSGCATISTHDNEKSKTFWRAIFSQKHVHPGKNYKAYGGLDNKVQYYHPMSQYIGDPTHSAYHRYKKYKK